MDLVLGALIQAGITALGHKAILAAERLGIVGSVVSLEGWIVEPMVVQRVLDWLVPNSVSEVRSFLGLAGVGHRCIKGFSLIAKPLAALLHQEEGPFFITVEAIKALETLKYELSTAPVLVKIDYESAKKVTRKLRESDEGLIVAYQHITVHKVRQACCKPRTR